MARRSFVFGSTELLIVDGSPEGVTQADRRTIALDRVSGDLFVNSNGGTEWNEVVPVAEVRLTRATPQLITAGSPTPISFDGPDGPDPDGFWSALEPTRITFPKTGRYSGCASMAFAGNPNGQRMVQVILNGSEVLGVDDRESVGGSRPSIVTASYEGRFVAGEYIEAVVQHAAAAGLNVINQPGARTSFEFTARMI
ncbi:MAG: hypothetical protein GTO22_14530 [Gemmatimonadales bacterium]|nr:hypothetical protein [Gemmatimonadales bacterium]